MSTKSAEEKRNSDPAMTDYKNELRQIIDNIRGDDYGPMNYSSYDEVEAAIEALLSKRELELLRHIMVGGRGGMELFVQNVPIESYKQQVSDRTSKLTNREEK